MNLQDRVQSPTPDWFKRIIKIGIVLASVGGAVLSADTAFPGMVLPALLKSICQYFVIGGLVAAAVSKTAKDDNTDGTVKAIVVGLIIACLVSCSPKMAPVQQSVVTRDSVITKVEYVKKDSIIRLPGDTVKLHDSLPCPGAVYHNVVTGKSGHITATVDLRNGQLNVDCQADSLQKRIAWLEAQTLTERFKTVTNTITLTVTAYKYKTPKWCWYLLGGCVLYAGARILIARYKIPVRL